MPITIRHGWRTRVREALAAVVAFGGGVVAATAGAAVAPRVGGGVLFLGGAYLVLDAVVLGASWRLTASGLRIPTVMSRRREIVGGSDLVVTATGRFIGAIVIAGQRSTRHLTVNPLVSPTDLRRWFAAIAESENSTA